MKTLADLILELQTIPNPEKVGIGIFDGVNYTSIGKHVDFHTTSPLDMIPILRNRDEAAEAGIEKLLLF